MPSDYAFLTIWRIPGTIQEVKDVLSDAEDLVRWWPSVYLDVRKIREGDENGKGAVTKLYTKGWLPYTLRWTFTITEPITDRGFALDAVGDFVGTGRWTFEQDGPEAVVTYDWRIGAEKPLLRRLTWLMRPIFAWNHRWAMAKGEESMRLEVRRRRARDERQRAAIPPPPGPTFTWLRR